jgi:hypothetical protein
MPTFSLRWPLSAQIEALTRESSLPILERHQIRPQGSTIESFGKAHRSVWPSRVEIFQKGCRISRRLARQQALMTDQTNYQYN